MLLIFFLSLLFLLLQKPQNKEDLYQAKFVKKGSLLTLEKLLSNSEPVITRNSGLSVIEMTDSSKEQEPIEIKRKGRRASIAKSVDFVSRFLFPCAFISFNIFYWHHYLNVE